MKKTQFIQLIEQEIEDFVQTQADKIVSFEDDPKEYILQKYPSLKSTLEDLMTDSFDEYVTGIYVMAPKPTTFKILLHNGQHFFLIYAKDSYIAKISGKKYYLSDLGAEEYAIKSIADLLTMGMPPGAEGPDQQAENDMTKDADETPDTEPTSDTEGDEEELAENVDDDEKDDYGRPFVDPKGSRIYLSDKEREDMKPSSRIQKMMDKLEKKLPSKKLRILKEAEEKKTFSKQDLVDLIDGIDDEDTLQKIFKYASSTGFDQSIDPYLKTKNLTDKDVTYFLSLLSEMGKLGEFAKIAENPPKLDLNGDNFYNQITGFTPAELENLFKTMKDSIKGTVSMGPGENFLSIFFGNVSKANSKGDLDVDGKEVELKARTGDSGAVVSPKTYNRGDFSKTVKPKLTKFINSLGVEPSVKKELEQINTPGKMAWPKKINQMFGVYLQGGGSIDKFGDELTKSFKELYPSLDFNGKDYLGATGFNHSTFTIDLAKQLATEYYDVEKFDAAMFADFKGNYQYYPENEFINAIGNGIKIAYPSDLLPRLKI
ncbi:hypothetical protein OAE25_00220 [Verrucomicrobiales bacterium]|nr:hypothetical protein [Schleiferiaceae bacterium]MDB4617069.1 hypothetical protein [Verrucomicrobiales bacterium]